MSTTFKNVWFRTSMKAPQNPEYGFDNIWRNLDEGMLTFNGDALSFVPALPKSKPPVNIDHIRKVLPEASGLRIRIEYGSGLSAKIAYIGPYRTNMNRIFDRGRKKTAMLLALRSATQTALPLETPSASPAQLRAIDSVVAAVLKLQQLGMSGAAIKERLLAVGLTDNDGDIATATFGKQRNVANAGLRNLIIGIVVCVGGIVLTSISFDGASPGDNYTVFYGAVIFGGFYAVAGLFQFLGAPRGKRVESEALAQHILENLSADDMTRWESVSGKLAQTNADKLGTLQY